jgi:hypothetical protein
MQPSFGKMEDSLEIVQQPSNPQPQSSFKRESSTPSDSSMIDDRRVPSYYPSMNIHDMIEPDSQRAQANRRQGTFLGVFLPDVQSIVGIILFVRLPWITGEAGIGMTLLILIICSSATFLTSLSIQ